MTKFYAYAMIQEYCARAMDENGEVPPFNTAEEAVRWAKAHLDYTDGTTVIQIIGFDDTTPVYTKTIVAKHIGDGEFRGRVL